MNKKPRETFGTPQDHGKRGASETRGFLQSECADCCEMRCTFVAVRWLKFESSEFLSPDPLTVIRVANLEPALLPIRQVRGVLVLRDNAF